VLIAALPVSATHVAMVVTIEDPPAAHIYETVPVGAAAAWADAYMARIALQSATERTRQET
jgi:hypothetical protein